MAKKVKKGGGKTRRGKGKSKGKGKESLLLEVVNC